jgi:hypothetical protein
VVVILRERAIEIGVERSAMMGGMLGEPGLLLFLLVLVGMLSESRYDLTDFAGCDIVFW